MSASVLKNNATVDSSQAAGETSVAMSATPPDSGPCVLLVDDEASILKSLTRLLRREPYEIITADSGQAALDLLGARTVHLVISDYRMPKMTGTELLERVRDLYPDTIRMILSGYAEINAIIRAINDGAIYRFLTKPWNDEELKLSVLRALEQHELLAENKRLVERIRIQNEQLVKANERLSQLSTDASLGLACAQNLMESINVAVIAVDANRLIVSANRRARDYVVQGVCDPVGIPFDAALPREIVSSLPVGDPPSTSAGTGGGELNGRSLEWRVNQIGGASCQTSLVLIWERVV
ncbi:MAG TPA: response regulator [Phycisphaerae bacterium]|nr:response regulator [Phycisphaerae bacterium]HRW53133.1 response regulator [Phycisphaerae bacterium]